MSAVRDRALAWARWSSTAYVLGHLADLLTTYLLSPRLSRESNVLVREFGLGWGGIVLSAVLASVLMIVAQRWLWSTMADRLPARSEGRHDFYHRLLLGSPRGQESSQRERLLGLMLAIACVVLNALVASKWLTVSWNLAVLQGFTFEPFALVKWAISLGAATIGFAVLLLAPRRLGAPAGDRPPG